MDMYRSEFERLFALLETEAERSSLPEAPTAAEELADLLKRLRLNTILLEFPIDKTKSMRRFNVQLKKISID